MTHVHIQPTGAWDDFDPNTTPFAKWATYVPDRRNSAAFKMHKTRGPALAAFGGWRRAILYEFDPQQLRWVERAKIDYHERPKECEGCGADLVARSGWGNGGRVTRIKPGLDYKWLCSVCRGMVS